jgi:hypothetical protein
VGLEGWVLLTTDKRIRYNFLEKRALEENAVREFVFTSGNMSGQDMAAALGPAKSTSAGRKTSTGQPRVLNLGQTYVALHLLDMATPRIAQIVYNPPRHCGGEVNE